jgi:hypothetical protein
MSDIVEVNSIVSANLIEVCGLAMANIIYINGIGYIAEGGGGPGEPVPIDFTDFTDVDEDSDLTITSTKISWDTMRRDAVTYAYGSYDAGYFGNFMINFEVEIEDIEQDAGGQIICIGNTVGTQQDILDAGDSIALWVYGSGSGVSLRFKLKDYDGAPTAAEWVVGGDSSVLLYGSFMKSGDMALVKFFTDEARTPGNHVKSLLYTDCQAVEYRYLSFSNRDATDTDETDTFTGYTQNWEILSEDYDGGDSYEDLETYTLVNGENKLSTYATTITWNDLDRNDAFYCYYDFGADYFEDYVIEWETEMFKGIHNTCEVLMCCLTNDIGTFSTFLSADVGMIFDWYWQLSVGNFRMRDFNGDVEDIYLGPNEGNWRYWFRMERSGTTTTVSIFSDPERENLVDEISIITAATKYRYFYVCNTRDGGDADACWGHSRDYNIISH